MRMLGQLGENERGGVTAPAGNGTLPREHSRRRVTSGAQSGPAAGLNPAPSHLRDAVVSAAIALTCIPALYLFALMTVGIE